MGKPTPGESRRAAKALSAVIKGLAARIGSALEADLVVPGSNQALPGLVSHYKHFTTASGIDSIPAYADELAQAVFFHLLSAKSTGAGATGARFLPGLGPLLEALTRDGGIEAELARYSIDQFSDGFHEAFLKEHDPGTKRRRGVFYTPAPAVRFIVRGIDELVKRHFGITAGITGAGIKLTDPACGTGAFLAEACKAIVTEDPPVAKHHLFDNIEGCDVMLSALVFCEMRITRLLASAGLRLNAGDAINLRHENSLAGDENSRPPPGTVAVVLGNPPYSVSSANKNAFIAGLMADYKQGLKERNMQPLSDDYVKFLRTAQWRVDRAGRGIVAFVTNNAYIYKMIYRRMRESLLSSFDDIYVVNLHGNVNIGEKTPAGDPDGNIFDIRVGTCIVFMVKHGPGSCRRVRYHEVFGDRESKLGFLDREGIGGIPFVEVEPAAPGFLFVKRDTDLEAEFEHHPSVKDIFNYFTIGVKTHRDDFIVELDRGMLARKVEAIAGEDPVGDIKARFRLNDSPSAIAGIRERLREEGIKASCFVDYLYRPFDKRVVYFSPSIITRHRLRVMQHMFHHDNVALVTTRLLSTADFTHCMVSRDVGDIGLLSSRTSESAYFFPLYLYPVGAAPTSNIKQGFMAALEARYPGTAITPELVLGYAYAILHARWYRERYAEPLKGDFPRIPLARDAGIFVRLAAAGSALVSLHLSWAQSGIEDGMPGVPGELVERIEYDPSSCSVVINDHHSIGGVTPNAWGFKIGNYQVLQKWLRGRKDKRLSRADEAAFERVARAVDATLEVMREIDAASPMQGFDGVP